MVFSCIPIPSRKKSLALPKHRKLWQFPAQIAFEKTTDKRPQNHINEADSEDNVPKDVKIERINSSLTPNTEKR